MSGETYTADTERDYKFELGRLLRETGPKVLDAWREVLEHGGRQTTNAKCPDCGGTVKVSVPVADVQQQRLILLFLQEQLAEGDAPELGAQKLIRDFGQMTNEELATYIVRLENEIAADAATDTPERRKLRAIVDELPNDVVPAVLERVKDAR